MKEFRKGKLTRIGYFGIEVGTRTRSLGFGFDIGGYDGDDITLGLYLILFSVWFKYSHQNIYKLCGKISKLIGKKYPRSYNSHIYFNSDCLSIEIFGDHVGEEALYHKYINLERFFKGKSKVERVILNQGETEIVMPEKRYKATYKITKMIFRYPRWFTRTRTDIDFDLPEGIPQQGKGENSWDCGMDHTFGFSTTYKGSLRGACDDLAIMILKQRQRHSSLDGYLNSPEVRRSY